MNKPCRMADDRRPIISAWTVPASPDGEYWEVGRHITHIGVYEEPGQGAMVPWIAIWYDGEVWIRLPASAVAIQHALKVGDAGLRVQACNDVPTRERMGEVNDGQ